MRPGCTLTHTDYSPIQSLAAVFNLKQIMHCVQPKNAQLYERTCMRVCVRGCERVCAYCAACACIHLCVCSYIRVCVGDVCMVGQRLPYHSNTVSASGEIGLPLRITQSISPLQTGPYRPLSMEPNRARSTTSMARQEPSIKCTRCMLRCNQRTSHPLTHPPILDEYTCTHVDVQTAVCNKT